MLDKHINSLEIKMDSKDMAFELLYKKYNLSPDELNDFAMIMASFSSVVMTDKSDPDYKDRLEGYNNNLDYLFDSGNEKVINAFTEYTVSVILNNEEQRMLQ